MLVTILVLSLLLNIVLAVAAFGYELDSKANDKTINHLRACYSSEQFERVAAEKRATELAEQNLKLCGVAQMERNERRIAEAKLTLIQKTIKGNP